MLVLIDKEKGMTSHDVVDEVRKITGKKKVGHAGTLDPNATGLLVIGVGRPTTKKLGGLLKGAKKTYEAEIFLGEERDTDDVEGDVISKEEDFDAPSKEEVEKILEKFVGDIEQEPPIFSAIKISGKKAYELAREGKKAPLEPREVTIDEIKILSYDYPILKIKTTVSSGTYIRALARDIGREIGSGAYLRNLRRTRVGEYSIDEAYSLEKLKKESWREIAE